MKKKSTIIIIIAAVIVCAIWFCVKQYNSFVNLDENTKTQWAQVENAYKRRADLIPNLVNTVKGYAAHEKTTFEAVVNARSKATQITIDPENITPEKLKEYQEAQGELQSALGKLLAITENYPELKANTVFENLQHQLEGTENRIATERNKYNEICNVYNKAIRVFPGNIISSIFGFERHAFFEATEAEKQVPQVQF